VYHYYTDECGHLRWRQAKDLPPAGLRMDSSYDPEAHFGTKRSVTWTGDKMHVTETCDDDMLHIITHVEMTAGAVPDVATTAPIQRALCNKQHGPGEHYVDATLLVQSPQEFRLTLIGPGLSNSSWQAQDEQAYDMSQFHIDGEAQQVTCPLGKISSSWTTRCDRWENPVISVKFAYKDCGHCDGRPHIPKPRRIPAI
jgi:transposase